jgi:1-deoxy-D-xylulose-5-phosphate synthase
MVLMASKDENELQHMLKTAVEYKGPAAVRYPRGKAEGVTLDDNLYPLKIGEAEELKKGNDAVIIAIGNMVHPSLRAAKKLEKEGVRVAVINARFVKPLDKKLLTRVAKEIGLILTVEENVLQGGFGSAVLELFEQENIKDVIVKRMGLPDQFIEHGNPDILREKYGLCEEGIISGVKSLLEEYKHNKKHFSFFLHNAGKRAPR